MLRQMRAYQYVGRSNTIPGMKNWRNMKWTHVFVYYPDEEIKSRIEINEDEVAEIRWISPEELEQWLSQAPADFSAWFAEAYALAKIKI